MLLLRTDVNDPNNLNLSTRDVLENIITIVNDNTHLRNNFFILLARMLVRFSGSFGPLTNMASEIDGRLGIIYPSSTWEENHMVDAVRALSAAFSEFLTLYVRTIPSQYGIDLSFERINEVIDASENAIAEEERNILTTAMRLPNELPGTGTDIIRFVYPNIRIITGITFGAGAVGIIFAMYRGHIPVRQLFSRLSDIMGNNRNIDTHRRTETRILPRSYPRLVGNYGPPNYTPATDPRAVIVYIRISIRALYTSFRRVE